MLLSQAFDTVLKFSPQEFFALSNLLSSELIDEYLVDNRVVTIHKRHHSINQRVSHLGIALSGSAVVHVASACTVQL